MRGHRIKGLTRFVYYLMDYSILDVLCMRRRGAVFLYLFSIAVTDHVIVDVLVKES
jgi:hypothetical protein